MKREIHGWQAIFHCYNTTKTVCQCQYCFMAYLHDRNRCASGEMPFRHKWQVSMMLHPLHSRVHSGLTYKGCHTTSLGRDHTPSIRSVHYTITIWCSIHETQLNTTTDCLVHSFYLHYLLDGTLPFKIYCEFIHLSKLSNCIVLVYWQATKFSYIL